jgi:hypothetical protein
MKTPVSRTIRVKGLLWRAAGRGSAGAVRRRSVVVVMSAKLRIFEATGISHG